MLRSGKIQKKISAGISSQQQSSRPQLPVQLQYSFKKLALNWNVVLNFKERNRMKRCLVLCCICGCTAQSDLWSHHVDSHSFLQRKVTERTTAECVGCCSSVCYMVCVKCENMCDGGSGGLVHIKVLADFYPLSTTSSFLRIMYNEIKSDVKAGPALNTCTVMQCSSVVVMAAASGRKDAYHIQDETWDLTWTSKKITGEHLWYEVLCVLHLCISARMILNWRIKEVFHFLGEIPLFHIYWHFKRHYLDYFRSSVVVVWKEY